MLKTHSLKITALLLIIILLPQKSHASNSQSSFDQQRPDKISDNKWNSLKSAAQDIKLLPTPNGIGALQSFFGGSISIDNNRALVGAPGFNRHGAVYVLELIGGNWQQTAVLVANDTSQFDSFGISVSLDGNRALIGANRDDDNGSSSGSAYVFNFIGGSWTQSAKLIANDGMADDEFGRSLSLHGNRVLIGSHRNDNSKGIDAGSVYVFDLNASSWSQTDKLIASDGANSSFFGLSISLFNNTALIGSFRPNGSAYIFDFSNNSWHETVKLQPNNGTADAGFGLVHDLENGRALITAMYDDENGNASGAAYIFDLINGNWTQSAKLIASDGAILDNFGRSASLSGDRVLIGSVSSAYVFDLDTNGWSETTKLVASDNDPNDFIGFGNNVAIWGDKVLIGASSDDDNDTDSGSAYDFRLTGSGWLEQAKLSADVDSAANDFFGTSVSILGNRALIGAPNDRHSNTSNTGAAYIFDWVNGKWTLTQKLLSSSLQNKGFGASVSLDNNRALIGAWDNNSTIGAGFIFDLSNGIWTQTVFFARSQTGGFGSAVSLLGNNALIGANLDDENGTDSGAVFLHHFNSNSWTFTEKIMPINATTNSHFGNSINQTGFLAIIGANQDDENGIGAGAAFVYELNNGFATQQAKLIPQFFGAGDRFGNSVSIDGNKALIGAPGDDDFGTDSGAAYLFSFGTLSGWNEETKFRPFDSINGDLFGTAVSLSGSNALISSLFDDDNGTDSGSAYIFNLNSLPQSVKLTANDGTVSDLFGISVSLFGDRYLIGSFLTDENGSNSGSAYIFDNNLVFRDGFE